MYLYPLAAIFHGLKVLSDKEKRATYDRHGEEGVKKMMGGGGGHDPFSSFFGDFFGGGHDSGENERPRVGLALLFLQIRFILLLLFEETFREQMLYLICL